MKIIDACHVYGVISKPSGLEGGGGGIAYAPPSFPARKLFFLFCKTMILTPFKASKK